MPFVRRHEIDPDLRAKFESAHKTQLRQALLSPTVTAEHRTRIKAHIDSLGKAKVYQADSPARPGAIAFEKVEKGIEK